MADDIEEFLRRAAQRRKQKANQSAEPPRRPKPEYSNARTERQVEVIEADVVEAKVIEEPSIGSLSSRHLRDSHLAEKVSLADDKMDEHIHQVFDHQVGGLASSSQSDRMPDETADDKVPENYVDALVGMLSSSTGLQQAILVREIFDRPTHRW